MTKKKRICGLDPGLRFLGWGVVEMEGSKITHIGNGTIASSADKSLGERLVELEGGLEKVLSSLVPQEVAIEYSFVNKDAVSSLKLGQARAICLLLPAKKNMEIAEYAPNHIKSVITGNGHADKKQMLFMVSHLLPGVKFDSEHSVDALAIALTHIQAGGRASERIAEAVAASEKQDRERKR
ncbi:MAG: crossover junction endodeoxyribonuclease RuvC [Parvibaculales bacterium]